MARTKTPEKERTAKKKAPGINRWKYARVILIIACIVILLGGIVTALWLFQRSLFAGNPRFTLRQVEVQSSGWWNARSKHISHQLKLQTGHDNLFSLDLHSIRKELRKIPSVESATVSRSLPDTLKIFLVERIPRARLKSANSPWVLDSDCVVMPKANCIDISTRLPVILGFYKNVRAGMVVPELKSALELISLVNEYFPDIQIQGLSVSNPEQLRFFMIWKAQPDDKYIVYMPRKNLKLRLTVLRSTIIRLRNSGDPRRTIDLNYSNTALLR
jgi:cell division septal protein FtsQ